jgi:hypothetical protein
MGLSQTWMISFVPMKEHLASLSFLRFILYL